MPALPATSDEQSPEAATSGNLAAEAEQPAQDGGSPENGQLHIDVGASTSGGDKVVPVSNGLERRDSRSSAEDSPPVPKPVTAVRWVGPPDGPLLAKLEAPDGTTYAVSKRKIVIGRESTHSETDMVVQENNYVSRGHLVLTCRDDGVWTVVCNGKNGVFVNSHLVKKGAEPTPVPKSCSLRFPSTSIRVGFQSLVPVAGDAPMPSRAAIEHGAATGVKTANASRDSGFVSPSDLVSPVRTVISPSSGARNNNNNKSLASSASPAAKSASGELSDGDDADGGAVDGKPPYSYAQLIVQAIASTADKQMTLSGIYAFITKTYPWYRTSDKGWQNSIRHNLSLNRYFIKVPRSQEEPGKGSFWRLDPSSEGKLLQFAFKKRRQRGGGKGVRSAPVSPGLEGSKSDGELHDIFPGDLGDSARSRSVGRSAVDVATALANSGFLHHNHLGIPNDPKPSIPRPSSLGSGRIDGVMVRPNDFNAVVRSAGTPEGVGRSPTSHLPSEASTPRIASAKDGKGVFRFSPIETNVAAGSSRYIQSAPCSPKGFGKDGFPKREHHHSGGPFRVRTSAKDGRHRLQLCHSPPEYVPVTRPDVSALQVLTQGQGRQSSKTLLQHYRGGSQSLSTTPVREILAGGPRMHQLLSGQDGERIAKALLDSSPEPKVLKRRIQENGHHHGQQHHPPSSAQASSSNAATAADASLFVQPLRAAPAAPAAARPADLLQLQQQAQQQQQAQAAQQAAAQQLAAQVYSNQLAAAAYLNPMLPAWAAQAAQVQQNAAATAAGLYPPGSFLPIGGAGRFPLLGAAAASQGLLGLDSARILAAAFGGNVGGPSVPKIARTE